MKETEQAAQTVELFELFVDQNEPHLELHNTGLWQAPRLTGNDLELHQIKFMDYAHRYANEGFFVIPQILKKPLISNWVALATVDHAQIDTWWEKRPDAELGIATGHGLAVLDIDPRNGGLDSLETLQERHGKLPKSVTVETGGGGFHHYFKVDRDVKSRKLAPGVELKGPGQFVVAPPSRHPNGEKYRWAKGSRPEKRCMAPLPAWAVELSNKARQEDSIPDLSADTTGPQLLDSLTAGAPKGSRNDTLFERACTMKRQGYPLDVIRKSILQAARNCFDSSNGDSAPFPEQEALDIVERVWRDYANTSGKAISETQSEQPVEVPATQPASDQDDDGWFTEIDLMQMPEVAWLVDKMIPASQPAMLYGDEGSFKSFLALDLACCVATGRNWINRPTQQGRVLYIAAEGAEGIPPRVSAWRHYHGLRDPLAESLQFKSTSVSLPDPAAVTNLAKQINDRMGYPIELIVVDTLTRCFGQGEFSLRDQDDVQKFMPQVDRLARETGATVLLIHHTGWPTQTSHRNNGDAEPKGGKPNRRPRGPRQLVGDLSSIIAVTCSRAKEYKTSHSVAMATLQCYKVRNAPEFDPINVLMVKSADSLVPEFMTEQPKQRLTMTQQRLLDFVAAAPAPVSRSDILATLGGEPGFTKGHLTKLLRQLISKGLISEQGKKGQAKKTYRLCERESAEVMVTV